MPAHRKNYDNAVQMYASGLSVGDVAVMYGVTRQAMYKILKRRGVLFRSKVKTGEENHFFRHGLPSDDRVHSIVSKAISSGRLIPSSCEDCGASVVCDNGRSNIHAHHDDYNKPLAVRWLCGRCHREWHNHNQPIRRTADLPSMPRQEICSLGGRASRRK